MRLKINFNRTPDVKPMIFRNVFKEKIKLIASEDIERLLVTFVELAKQKPAKRIYFVLELPPFRQDTFTKGVKPDRSVL